jgi:hypothetical protein
MQLCNMFVKFQVSSFSIVKLVSEVSRQLQELALPRRGCM